MRLKISSLLAALALSIALPSTSFAADEIINFCDIDFKCGENATCVAMPNLGVGSQTYACVLNGTKDTYCTPPGHYSTKQVCCSTGQPPKNGLYGQCK